MSYAQACEWLTFLVLVAALWYMGSVIDAAERRSRAAKRHRSRQPFRD